MLKECLDIFRLDYEQKGDKLLLDNYIPSDGTYIFVEPNGDSFYSIEKEKNQHELHFDKKTKMMNIVEGSVLNKLRYYDYHSKLIDMNKPVDSKKIIHSNNYLAFFVKKESLGNGKLTFDIIDKYYDTLSEPRIKYNSNKRTLKLYEAVEEKIGPVNQELVEKIRGWIKKYIFKLDIDTNKKEYLKIFFCYPDMIENEEKRYLIPNIYNSNDFNVKVEGEIYGVPNNNMGLNFKKPFLENKSRKITVPYLVSNEEIILHKKFFEYLMNFAMAGKVNIYINTECNTIKGYEGTELPQENIKGYYLRILKKKEVEIHDFDIVSGYRFILEKPFVYHNYLKLDMTNKKVAILKNVSYVEYVNRKELEELFNEVLFSKSLINNYYTEAKNISVKESKLKVTILQSRKQLFDWLHKGINRGIEPLLESVTWDLIKNTLNHNNRVLAQHQFNLRYSIIQYFNKGDEDMGEIMTGLLESTRSKLTQESIKPFENDNEYFFAMGQLIYYLNSKNKGSKKMHSSINPYLSTKSDMLIKEKLKALFKKYNYDIPSYGKKFNRLYSMVEGYEANGKINHHMILLGYLTDNLLYEENKENKKGGNDSE